MFSFDWRGGAGSVQRERGEGERRRGGLFVSVACVYTMMDFRMACFTKIVAIFQFLGADMAVACRNKRWSVIYMTGNLPGICIDSKERWGYFSPSTTAIDSTAVVLIAEEHRPVHRPGISSRRSRNPTKQNPPKGPALLWYNLFERFFLKAINCREWPSSSSFTRKRATISLGPFGCLQDALTPPPRMFTKRVERKTRACVACCYTWAKTE